MNSSPAGLTSAAGGLVAAIAAIGVATTDDPHLSFDRIDPWLAAFALGLAVALGSLAFVFHDRVAEQGSDPGNRWERALTRWGAATLGLGIAFVLLGLASGFDGSSAGGALAIVGCFECGLILISLLVLVLGT